MSQQVSLESLLQNQHDLYGRITRAFENLKKIGSTNVTVGIVESRLQALEQNWRKFESQHDYLLAHYREQVKSTPYVTEDVFSTGEESYLTQRGQFMDTMTAIKPLAHTDSPISKSSVPAPDSRTASLPRIHLPQFSGRYEDWTSFRDLFTSLIRKETQLTNVEKLHYLKASMKGEAEQLLKNITVSNENFSLAWELLQGTYENKRLIVRSHLNALTTLPNMTSESADELKKLVHTLYSSVGGLEGIGRPIHSNTDLLVHLIVSRLDKQSRRDWEEAISGSLEPPTYDELKTFLEKRLRMLETIAPPKSPRTESKQVSSSARRFSSTAKSHTTGKQKANTRRCAACEGDHFVLFCKEYQAHQPDGRKALVTRLNLCYNCLGRHMVSACQSTKTCSKCQEKHHTSIHDACVSPIQEDLGGKATPPKTTLVSRKVNGPHATILLATALVKLRDCSGELHLVRALVDPGSEVSLVTESLVQRLRLSRRSASVPIVGVGASSSGISRGSVLLNLISRVNMAWSTTVHALILPRLTSYGVKTCDITHTCNHLKDLTLADPHYFLTEPVELLLGVDIYGTILEEGLRKGGPRTPIAQKTSLGWILSGVVSDNNEVAPASSLQCSIDEELTSLVRSSWEHDEIPDNREPAPLTEEEQQCEDHYASTHFRLPSGRYVVRLPLKHNLSNLTGTRNAAIRLLQAMERRFTRDAQFSSLYHDFLKEYEALGHMQHVSRQTTLDRLCYLPHHGVFKESSTTTKLRVVFNGSQLTMGHSLNEHLHIGPKLLPNLIDIVLRWRLHTYVMTADIEKMYRQILVHSDDRNLQRILWRKTPTAPIEDFQLKTVTYGLACAPFLAIRTLRQLARDEEVNYPLAAPVLRTDVYVDDVLTGASTLTETLELQRQLMDLCKGGGFPLRKWAANDDRLLTHLEPSDITSSVRLAHNTDSVHSTLGLLWHPSSDSFSFSLNLKLVVGPLTKRHILSHIAQLFDPLGWLSPVSITSKIFLQSLWLRQLEWDSPLSTEDTTYWNTLRDTFSALERIRIPRRLGNTANPLELHGFADASERAYAAVLYLRWETSANIFQTSLVAAKAKVTPIKQISLPRLELTAAVLLLKLAAHIKTLLNAPNLKIHMWSDSMVTLGWIQAHPSKWKTYVANRVSEIQRTLPEARWHHVRSEDNPADCASRGLLPQDLEGHPLWWHGPPWLTTSPATWAQAHHSNDIETLPEQRFTGHVTHTSDSPDSLVQRFSSLTSLLRTIAWCLRWKKRTPQHSHSPFLVPKEITMAKFTLFKQVQRDVFTDELDYLTRGQPMTSRSPLLKLNAFTDHEGLLRVGGRLKHSLLNFDERHPIILPRTTHFTTLVIRHCHAQTLHGGVQLTLHLLRQQYWILQGRQAVRSCLQQCAICTRWRAATRTQLMGDLPARRVTPSRPFLHTGLDYAGPLLLRMSKGRGCKSYKGYIVIFVCCSTKAVHLEPVSDYTSDAFLAAYRRFVSRRGLCQTLSSDCGTNLVGADAQLRHLLHAANREFHGIANQLSKDGVEWRFNPPSAPHFGGLWEAAVKSVKFHLRRVIGESTLTFEEMYTVLSQVEACLNSRPLQAISDDPDDLTALTPGHFLVNAPVLSIPEPMLDKEPLTRLNRWQLLQHMRDSFWRRWSQEYLHTLQARTKWWRPQSNVTVGDLCIIKNELHPPSRWPLGRITQIHPGQDDKVRVVTVRTSTSELKRPITKIVLLPNTAITTDS